MQQFVFPSNPLLGFFTVLLFIAHPVHTEVVANIKSRDEILSLLFIALTGTYLLRYFKTSNTKNLFLCIASFSAALLSKEYAIVLPFILVTGLIIIHHQSYKSIINSCTKAMFGVLMLFVVMRFSAFNNSVLKVKKDVLNDPYLFANTAEKLASKISIILEYLRVLIYPKNLSYDYSYNHLPYSNFGDWQSWVAIFIYLSLGFATVYLYRKKHIISFMLVVFLGFFILVNNLIFPIGATMGERLIYHSSLGFCMILVWGINYLIEKFNNSVIRQTVATIICICILIPLCAKTIDRNQAWKSDYELHLSDVSYVRESALANSNAGTVIFNAAYKLFEGKKIKTAADTASFRQEIHSAIYYFKKAVDIHPKYLNSHLNLGLCYFNLNEIERAVEYWEEAGKLFNGPYPALQTYARIFLDRGIAYGQKKQFNEAIIELQRAIKIYPYDADIWENLGGAYFMTAKFDESREAFSKSLSLNPYLTGSLQGKGVAENFLLLQEKTIKDSLNPVIWLEAGDAYQQGNFIRLAEDAYQRVLKLDRNNSEARNRLQLIKNR
ncbi:MAG: tetratricopeptide repeat protein [Cytophagaceae bacterium]